MLDKIMSLSSYPSTISKPGIYKLMRDQILLSPIEIVSDGVVLDLNNHTLSIKTDDHYITIRDRINITIRNGTITMIDTIEEVRNDVGPTNSAIYIHNANNIQINNITIGHIQYGIIAINVSNINIANIKSYNISYTAYRLSGCDFVNISDTTTYNCGLGMRIGNYLNNDITTKNVIISDWKGYNSDLLLLNINNIAILNSQLTLNNANNHYNMIQVGANDEVCNNLTIKNTSLYSDSVGEGFDAISIIQCTNATISNTTINAKCPVEYVDSDISYIPGLIHIGTSQLNVHEGYDIDSLSNIVSNIVIKDCQLYGLMGSASGIYIDGEAKSVSVDGCNVSGMEVSRPYESADIYISSNAKDILISNNITTKIVINDSITLDDVKYSAPTNVVLLNNVGSVVDWRS